MTNKPTIVHLIQSLDNGGCENMLLRTLPLINDYHHLIVVMKKKGELADKFAQKKIPVIQIRPRLLVYKLTKINPSLIITYLFHADLIGRLIIQPRTRFTVIPFLRTTYNHPKYWLPRLFEYLTKFMVKRYFANSQSVKNFYCNKIRIEPEKITVIPNGIDVTFFQKIRRDKKLIKKLGIHQNEAVIICVANLHINKGHRYLLEAFEKVFQSRKNIKLLLVGDGVEKNNLIEQVKDYASKDNIMFLGKRTDVPQLLKISDIFVLPTLFEGMSNAIMEAMASKLAIITTNIPENRELMENNKTGILIPAKNSVAITQAIINLIDNSLQRKILSNNANKKVREKFDIYIVSKLFDNYFHIQIDKKMLL